MIPNIHKTSTFSAWVAIPCSLVALSEYFPLSSFVQRGGDAISFPSLNQVMTGVGIPSGSHGRAPFSTTSKRASQVNEGSSVNKLKIIFRINNGKINMKVYNLKQV